MVDYPSTNEIVICKIIKITDFGVFASLLEYENIEGFIHISQVSSTWIKNIHNHVKINQIRAAKVLKIDNIKNQIDLSFNRVSSADEKRKIADYRLFKRAMGLLEEVSKELNIDNDTSWNEIAEKILETENNLYNGFINIVRYGKDYYQNISEKYRSNLYNILSKNITVKDKTITASLEISSELANGSKVIKKSLAKAIEDNASSSTIVYLAPGRYELKVSGKDYKIALSAYNKITEKITKLFKGSDVKIIKADK
ncbi:MAG: S1 RNA-binding domain-containing protein [archaeon]